MRYIFFLTILLALVAAPNPYANGAVTSKRASTAALDSVGEFKALISEASEPKSWSIVYWHAKNGKWAKQYYAMGAVAFDVKKTESLVSPVVGTVSFPVEITQSEFFSTADEAAESTSLSNLRVTFYYDGQYQRRDDKWQVEKFTYRAGFNGGPPDKVTITVARQELLEKKDAGSGAHQPLGKWIR